MRRFVFEADIIVPRLELHRQRYEISMEDMRRLLDMVPAADNELHVTAEDLDDLLTNTGEISTYVSMSARQDAVRKLLTALSKVAWENDLPWKLDQAEGYGIGDERFHECVRAYIMPDENHPLGVGSVTLPV
jgi:hypothetical protein